MGRLRLLLLFAVSNVALAACPPSAAGLTDSPWPAFRHDSLHTGRSALPGPAGGSVGWTSVIGVPGTASPAVANGRIYAVGGGNLVALGASGAVLWSAPCGSTGSSSPAIADDGTIYVASTDQYLYAFRPDGALKWKRALQSLSESSPVVGPDGTVYVGASSGKLFAYHADGSQKFVFTAGGAIASSPALASDGTVYFGCDDGCVYAVKPAGTLKWKFTTNPISAVRSSPSVGSDGTVYFGSLGGYFFAVWPTGVQRWRYIAGGGIVSSPALAEDGSVCFGCRDRAVYCLASTGALKWRTFTGGNVDSSPAIDSAGTVYVGSYDGSIYAVSPTGSVMWSTHIGSAVTASPALGDGGLYAVSRDGVLTSFSSDQTPPPAPVVTDDGDFSSSPSILHATWACSDPESGISRYEYSIRDSQGRDVVPFTDAGLSSEVTRTDLQLASGETYYFAVRATNGALLVSGIGLSDGIRVDLTPPTIDSVSVGVTALEVRVTVNASDSESGVGQVQCALLTSPDLPPTPNWVGGAPGQETVFPGPFDPASVFYVAARAVNRAGSWSSASMTGPWRMDNTPPTVPVVTDDGAYTSDPTTLRASWVSQDPESGIDRYSYCVGSAAGASDIVGWTSTTSATVTLTGLSLANGSIFYFSVKAFNRAGLVSAVGSSDGIKVDTTPPPPPTVIDDGEITSSRDCLHVLVSAADPESGIIGFIYCIGTAPGASDVLPETAIGNQSSITACGLGLLEGTRYYVTAKAVNGAGLRGPAASSDGIEYRPSVALWRKFRSDSRNSGCALVRAPTTGRLHWRVQTQGYIESSAAVAGDGTAYVGSSDGKLYAISPVGTVKWTYGTGSCIDSSPAIGPDGCVYFGSYGGLHCVQPNGTPKWKFATPGMVWSSPNIGADGTVYFGCQDNRFRALNPDGTLKWTFVTGGAVWSSPAIGPDGSLYFACGDGKLYALSATGSLKWAYQTGSAADSSPAVAEDGTIYFGSGDGYVYSLTPSGALRWRVYVGQVVDSSPAVTNDGRIYVGVGGAGHAGALYAFSSSGTELWNISLSGGVRASPAVDENGNVCFASTNGKVYLVNRDGLVLWSYSTGDSILSSPAFGVGGSVIVGSDDGGVYCFRDQGVLDNTPPSTPEVHIARQFIAPGQPLEASWFAFDPESGIRSYSYAVGTSQATDDVVSWTEVGAATSISRSDLPLLPGVSYYVLVRATNHALLQSATGVSSPVTVVAGDLGSTVGGAKKRLLGTQVSLPGKIVTAVFDDCAFIEEPNRSSGIRVTPKPFGLQPGAVVNVTGSIGLRYGETVLTSATATPSGFEGTIAPVGLPCDTLCKVGLDVMGLLVRVAGRVSRVGSGWFVIDDGSSVFSARGVIGTEVRLASGAVPAVGANVAVIGIACRELAGARVVTVIRALPGAEVTVYP
jgi:outer membrane protein assembly factor BamB